MATDHQSVLILGAGVHGAAIARELVLNGVGVHLVDKFDLAYGATSKSSRLIHGGLRYLEYGDFRLVKESLEARYWNLELAPQFVRPLWLHIPTSRRWSGLFQSAIGFLGWSRTSWGKRLLSRRSPRGYWPTRLGLWLYDCLARHDISSYRSSSAAVGTPGTPRINPQRYRWLCSYADAQMLFPERLILALLDETRELAGAEQVPFQMSTYTLARIRDSSWELQDMLHPAELVRLKPDCVVNATGAWGDETLQQLGVESPALFGGTKGTHFITWNDDLRQDLQGEAVYAEADDGRLVFVLPFGDGTLVGTTDETFAAKPETAAATEEELEYLLQLVNHVMDCRLTRDDIVLHYSGVRPLPRSGSGNNSAVSRDHALVEHLVDQCPVLTLVGGKLTTWREFSQQVSHQVLRRLNQPRTADAAFRPVSGQFKFSSVDGRGSRREFPASHPELRDWQQRLIREFRVPASLIEALLPLYGLRLEQLLADCRGDLGLPIRGTAFTTAIVRWIIDREWVGTLPDLVERRLMLVFARELQRPTLIDLAECLVAAGKLPAAHVPTEIQSTIERLRTYYGRRIEP